MSFIEHVRHIDDDAEDDHPHCDIREDHVLFRIGVLHFACFLSVFVLPWVSPFLYKSFWLWLRERADDDERHECCHYHDDDERAVKRPVVPVIMLFHNKSSFILLRAPARRAEKKAREELSISENEILFVIRWIVETLGNGLRRTLLALPDCYARGKHEAEQQVANLRFSCRWRPMQAP